MLSLLFFFLLYGNTALRSRLSPFPPYKIRLFLSLASSTCAVTCPEYSLTLLTITGEMTLSYNFTIPSEWVDVAYGGTLQYRAIFYVLSEWGANWVRKQGLYTMRSNSLPVL